MFKNLISYIKNDDYVIGVYDKEIYICNYKRIIDVNNNYIKIDLGKNKVKITGNDLSVKKLENKEILIKINTKGIEFYE